MAMDIVQSWHDLHMAQERARVLDRIAYGTKATSPQVIMARRMNSLYYSNPLPDNSSGSKNRPIGAAKDESGRPDANMLVAMAQGAHHFPHEGMPHGGMRGGVLRNYQYAKTILDRRGRNTEDINLASQGLPPVPSPLLELSDVESRKLELDTLLQSLSNQIEVGSVSSITISELKNIPRLLVALSPIFTQNDISQLVRIIDSMLRDLEVGDDEESPLGKNASLLYTYLDTRVRSFLGALAKIVNLSPPEKMIAIRQLAKEAFSQEPVKTKFPSAKSKSVAVDEEGRPIARPAAPAPAPRQMRIRREVDEAPEEEEELTADQKADRATEIVRRFEGSRSNIPDELRELYENATGNSSEGKNFGTVRQYLLNWIKRNKNKGAFDAWYEENIA